MASTTVAPTASPADNVDLVIDVVSTAFESVPLVPAFIVEIDNTPPPYPSLLIDAARRSRHFADGLRSGFESGSLCLQAGDWSAVAVWEPPEFKGKPFFQTGSGGPLRNAWRARIEAAKAKYLEGKPFWHLAFLARNPKGPAVPGATSAVVRPILEKARADGVPVWLEAVDERGVAIYTHWGFELVEHVVLGAGTHGKHGWPEEGGEGVSGYCMIYRP